jgi:uncharacterized protein (TIGR00299 family) protein
VRPLDREPDAIVIGWLDLASGASGDMLLAAVVEAGAPEQDVERAIASVAPERTSIRHTRVRRGALSSRRTTVEVVASTTHRGLSDVLAIVDEANLSPEVRDHAREVFRLLGEAEGAVHGIDPDHVHFHEVGALDALADVVGVCAGFVALDLHELHASPIAVGGGTVGTDHGRMSVPVPAVVRLLEGVPTYGGPIDVELCTPTGAALLRHWVTTWGRQPPMRVQGIGVGAGAQDFASHANVVRLLVGEPTDNPALSEAVVLEANVDDLDPRIWPTVLRQLFDAGASDAWLTPIVMKKGRPAHTLSVLAPPDRVERIRDVVIRETTAIGMRQQTVGKYALRREFAEVTVAGRSISVKIARTDGDVVNVQPEYDDVIAAADAIGWPVKRVLAAAHEAAAKYWE